eukprot:1136805-Pelagomonas_calceolata.AAC.2
MSRCFVQKRSKQFSIVCIALGSFAVNVKSSAYNECVTCTPSFPVTPCTPSARSFMSLTYQEKSKGDRGQPCFKPVFGCMRAVFSPSFIVYSSNWRKRGYLGRSTTYPLHKGKQEKSQWGSGGLLAVALAQSWR